jgi:hypothetical protein
MDMDSIDWTMPYIAYLDHQVLPQDKMEARMIQRRCKSFVMINNKLYKRRSQAFSNVAFHRRRGAISSVTSTAGTMAIMLEHVRLLPRKCAMASTGS